MFRKTTPAEIVPAYARACAPAPVTTGTCAMCHASGIPVIPLGPYPGAPSECEDSTACRDRTREIAARRVR